MSGGAPRRFVLDTSVLLHDPTALFNFNEHAVHLPVAVLRELDTGKRGASEEARNARQASRFLDDLLAGVGPDELAAGLPLGGALAAANGTGRLYFCQSEAPDERGDDAILEAAAVLQRAHPDTRVTLVSKDINLRIQATVLGLHAEDYESDRALDDLDLLYTGLREIPATAVSRDDDGRLRLGAEAGGGYGNECLYTADGAIEGRRQDGTLARVTDYRADGETVWGVHARNREQNFAFNLLMDPAVDFVTLLGPAGTGKTLLALAAGLAQTFESGRYREIVMTRATVAIGEDIGYLPGSEEEKMTPWMGALMDNLEVLGEPQSGNGRWAQAATQDVLRSRIRIRSLNFMRGRTFLDRYIILDEAQNLTAKQMKTLITRAGPGSKVVCLGNIAQIDTPYLTGTTSGLTYVVDRFRGWPHGGHITLRRGERSRLADFASEAL